MHQPVLTAHYEMHLHCRVLLLLEFSAQAVTVYPPKAYDMRMDRSCVRMTDPLLLWYTAPRRRRRDALNETELLGLEPHPDREKGRVRSLGLLLHTAEI
jgi:hypothetical protein